MNGRKSVMITSALLLVSSLVLVCASSVTAADKVELAQRQLLTDGWMLKSSVLVPEDGARVSAVDYRPQEWFKTTVPATVLTVLV